MAVSFSYFSILTLFCILCAHVVSKPLYRHQKRNSHGQHGLRRCGNEDFNSATSSSTEYRYLNETLAPRISNRLLSWKIARYPEALDNHTTVESVNFATSQALSIWSSVANLQFHHINSGTPDIEIKFQFPKTHNRQCIGVLRTGIIGHYVPGSINPGKIHFNEQFEWTTTRFDSRSDSINLVNSIAHEVGHLLGFGHTVVPNSIMSRYYSDHVFTAPIVLSSDDISAVTNRYGVKIHSNRTVAVPSTTIETVTASSTTAIFYGSSPALTTTETSEPTDCNRRHMNNSFIDEEGSFEMICATLYELDNCRGRYLMMPARLMKSLKPNSLGSWENRISSLVVTPKCRAKVFSVVDGNRIRSGYLNGTITSLRSSFDKRVNRFSCSCDFCPIPFPITIPNKNICAVAYLHSDCRATAKVSSPGQVWLRSVSKYWKNRSFRSAQVNPNCTVNFCRAETITNHTCLTLNGGAIGQSYPDLDSIFMDNVTSVHCGCVLTWF